MKPFDCMLTIVVPKSLEEQLIDRLLEHSESVVGFTTTQVEGHGRAVKRHGIAEEVRGRSRRIQVQLVMNSEDAWLLLRDLKSDFANPEIAYWMLPISAFGRFA
ncbi:MAG TPA: DUF3240 family protein [Burkholderiales bacterium]|nr:DUF3240 family protein [Burkholderiales bacterium]